MGISAELQNHLQGTTTLAVFLKITAKDGTVIAVWNGTRDKIFGELRYHAYPVKPSTLQAKTGLEADNLEVAAAYAEELFIKRELRTGKWIGARVDYRVMNYKDFSMGYLERRTGFVGESEVGRFESKVELESLSTKLSQPVGRVYTKNCDSPKLGGPRCKVDLTGTTVDGYKITLPAEIGNVYNRQQFEISFQSDLMPGDPSVVVAPNGLYDRGEIKFLSGKNSGLETMISVSVANQMTLFMPAFFDFQTNDTLEIIVGCSRRIEMCRDRFANAINFQGFFTLPGTSKLFDFPE